MPHPLGHKYLIFISQLCLVNTDVPAGVGAPPLNTKVWLRYTEVVMQDSSDSATSSPALLYALHNQNKI